VCGLRSGAAVRKDAELVPLWVGKYDPALIALADVGVPGTQVEQATDLFVLLPVVGLAIRKDIGNGAR
jgi:hypothetical protein